MMNCTLCGDRVPPRLIGEHRRTCNRRDRRPSLAMSNESVARLTRNERESRVYSLISESHRILDDAIEEHIVADERHCVAIVALFSGGNDSTTLFHLFRDVVTHAAHANTTIGIEKTRDFVRNVCEEWGVQLLERKPPREVDHYRALVLDQGFPGPGHHFKMFQRLKERPLRQIRNELVSNPRQQRVVFIAGRRRTESQRRAQVPMSERQGSIVWASPLVNWTKMDMNTYRLMQGDVPVNEVSDLIHMSGECLCGSFASAGEREEVGHWFPDVFEEIAALEAEISDREDIPDHRKRWGWGSDPAARPKRGAKPSKVGALCTSCDDRFSGPDAA